jgi:hypothetical protein
MGMSVGIGIGMDIELSCIPDISAMSDTFVAAELSPIPGMFIIAELSCFDEALFLTVSPAMVSRWTAARPRATGFCCACTPAAAEPIATATASTTPPPRPHHAFDSLQPARISTRL